MIVFPDIELQAGRCVNLVRGQMDRPVVYQVDPLETAKKLAAEGAEWLHVVDLDAVAQKAANNAALIEEIIQAVHVPVQVSGGIRSAAAIDSWIERGAARVVVATSTSRRTTAASPRSGGRNWKSA